MVVKITRQSGLRTEAIPAVATPSEPVDVFQKGVDEIVERFRSEPVTPQRFLELENALHAAAAEACRQLIEREANRLEADDKQVVPSKMRYHKETYRLNKKTPARIATRFGTITVRSFYYLNEEDGEPGLHPLLLRLGIRPRRRCWNAWHGCRWSKRKPKRGPGCGASTVWSGRMIGCGRPWQAFARRCCRLSPTCKRRGCWRG